ncbi:MAG: amiE [Gammaproteobacteria bacterium]|nr:amiE [Gammaproteobacteria bacterium]
MHNENTLPLELRSATELLRLLRERRLGSLELLDLQLSRIERVNPTLNAVVAMDVEGASQAARAADNTPDERRGPLHGLPITIKDAYETVGMTATCGFPELAGHRPQRDADAVARLRAAGAVPFGKTNVPLAAADHQSYNALYGTTNNPWNPERTPGGSSGGAAAAVAAGFSSLELGSDIGGSIRCPAHFCGVYGHKSSYNLVPMRGHIPPPPGALSSPPLGIGGPIARSATDLELALDVLAAPTTADLAAWSVRVPPSRHERLADFRVALWADQKAYSVDRRCVDAMHSYADELRRHGVQVDPDARPKIDVVASDDLYVAMLFSTVSAGMPEDVLVATEQVAQQLDAGPHSYPTRIARAVRLTHHDFLALQEQQQRLRAAWERFFQRYDVILCPISPGVAFPHDHSGTGPGHIAQYSRTLVVDGQSIPYLNGLQWPGLVTVANLPATAIPTGRLIDGLPMGLQVVGPYLQDRTSLRFAQLAEQALGGYVPPPVC